MQTISGLSFIEFLAKIIASWCTVGHTVHMYIASHQFFPDDIVQPSHDVITDHDYSHSSNLNHKTNLAPIYWLPVLIKDFISFSRKGSDRPETVAQNFDFLGQGPQGNLPLLDYCTEVAHRSSVDKAENNSAEQTQTLAWWPTLRYPEKWCILLWLWGNGTSSWLDYPDFTKNMWLEFLQILAG